MIKLKPGDEVWDVQVPQAPKRCTVVLVEGDWAVITWDGGRRHYWRTPLCELAPVSAVDRLAEIANG